MHDILLVSREERLVALREWWSRLDRMLLLLFGVLFLTGIVLCATAGPVAAMRKGIDNPFHFVERQLVFSVPAVLLMLGVSFLSPVQIRRTGILVLCSSLVLMLLTLLIGPDIKGASRWLAVGGSVCNPQSSSSLALPL